MPNLQEIRYDDGHQDALAAERSFRRETRSVEGIGRQARFIRSARLPPEGYARPTTMDRGSPPAKYRSRPGPPAHHRSRAERTGRNQWNRPQARATAGGSARQPMTARTRASAR